MKTSLIGALILSSLTLNAADKNGNSYLTVIGGGGEPRELPTTIFDRGVLILSTFAQENKASYKTTINFNGGHAETEASVAEKYQGSTIQNGFNQESFDKMVNDYIEKITSNPPQIKSGEKILIFINSHGGESKGKTHSISAAFSTMQNMNTGSETGMVSLDSLAKLSEAAEKANVKLGIIDNSCHSGNSLVLANSKTCVVSSSGPKHFGITSFPSSFASKMQKGKNLEEIFLAARSEIGGFGFPEISTPAGKKVQDELYPLVTPYLYYHSEQNGMPLDKIDTYLKEKATSYASEACMRENEYVNLTTLLTLIEDVTSIERKSIISLFTKKVEMEKTIDLSELKTQIKAYRKMQEDYIKKLGEISRPSLDKKEPMLVQGIMQPGLTHKELIATDWPYNIALKNKDLLDTTLSAEKRKNLIFNRDYFIAAQAAKEKILREHNEYTQYQTVLDSLKTDVNTSVNMSENINKQTDIAYNAYYKYQQQKLNESKDNRPNPCKDFVL